MQTSDLEIGTTLGFDLTDTEGQVLLKAGIPVSERLKTRLQQRNITSVSLRGAAPVTAPSSGEILHSCFPADAVMRLQSHIAHAEDVVRELLGDFENRAADQIDELHESLDEYIGETLKDLSTAIAVLISHDDSAEAEVLDRLAARSTRLSMLGAIASISIQNSIDASIRIGMIGLLHDVSLIHHTSWFSKSQSIDDDFLRPYQQHPLDSAEMLSGIEGIDPEFVRSVTQVHEQIDGSGFPRGLVGNQIGHEAQVLNFADAFLTLVDPLIGRARYLDADALAYLCHHACVGRFDRDIAMGVIESMSLYPVGSVVELNDGRRVVVVESVPGSPTFPIVREPQTGSAPIDLRKSDKSIVGPIAMGDRTESIRLRKHQMTELLWQ